MATKTKVSVVARDITEETTATTPNGFPDVELVPITILQKICIRAARTYVFAVLGLMGYSAVAVNGLPTPMPIGEFTINLQTALQMAVAPTILSILFNLAALFAKMDESSPSIMA